MQLVDGFITTEIAYNEWLYQEGLRKGNIFSQQRMLRYRIQRLHLHRVLLAARKQYMQASAKIVDEPGIAVVKMIRIHPVRINVVSNGTVAGFDQVQYRLLRRV